MELRYDTAAFLPETARVDERSLHRIEHVAFGELYFRQCESRVPYACAVTGLPIATRETHLRVVYARPLTVGQRAARKADYLALRLKEAGWRRLLAGEERASPAP